MLRDRQQNRYFCLLFLLLGLSTAGFAQVNKAAYTVVFCGKISGVDTTQQLAIRLYKDFLTFDEVDYPVQLNDDSFHVQIPISKATPGFLVFDNTALPIFTEPSDSIHLQSEATNFVASVEYSGRGGLANTYLKATFLTFDTKDPQRVDNAIAKNTAKGYQQLLTAYKREKFDFLDRFLTKRDTQLTSAFSEYVKADINYWWGRHLMRYREEHPASSVLPVSLNLSEEYFRFVDTLDLNNENALNNVHYLNYLEQYLKWRGNLIARGKLKFKHTALAKKELIKVKMVETFGQVLIDQLAVRKEAYDGLSTFAKLERGSEVLYLQDVTNDRFLF
ncbi:MAG: hypothetical protein AAGJ18_25640, partial [Bacteroidota bacterium]